MIQRDWIMEAEDVKLVTDQDALALVQLLPTEALLSVKQVARAIGRSDNFVRDICDAGELKVLGGRPDKSKKYILIYRASVVRYIQSHTK